MLQILVVIGEAADPWKALARLSLRLSLVLQGNLPLARLHTIFAKKKNKGNFFWDNGALQQDQDDEGMYVYVA